MYCIATSAGIRAFPIFESIEWVEVFESLKANLEKTGSPVDDFDLILASCAIANNLVLVTNNTQHFNRIAGLKQTNWAVHPEK